MHLERMLPCGLDFEFLGDEIPLTGNFEAGSFEA